MYGMGYLSMSQSSEAEERILLSTMWSSLGGEQSEKLPKEVIRAFLIAVEGVKITDGVKTDGPEEFGETKDDDFYPDCEKISKHFKLFYLNRIRYIGLREQPRNEKAKQEVEQECTFQPQINEQTETYARKYRERIAEQNEGEKITVLDILTAQTNKEQWIEETKKDLEEREKKNCTFRPKTNKYKGNRRPMQNPDDSGASESTYENQATGDKCEDLYQLSIIKQKKKLDKTTEEIEFEKAKQELTFQPNLSKKKGKTQQQQRHKINQRSVMDNIERMRRAREERERKKAMTERGYQPGKNIKAMEHGKEKAPLQQKQPYNYQQKKRIVPRRPEESTLYQNIGHFKQRPNEEDPFEEPSFKPNIHVHKRAEAPSPPKTAPARRPAHQHTQNQPTYAQRHSEDELEDIKQSSPELYEEESPDQIEEDSPEQPLEQEDKGEQQQEMEMEMEMGAGVGANEQDEGEDGNPLLFVDVNLGPGRAERIVVYEGDTAEALADEFTRKHCKSTFSYFST